VKDEDIWVEVHSAVCELVSKDMYGQVKSGRLQIEGRVTKALLRWSPLDSDSDPPDSESESWRLEYTATDGEVKHWRWDEAIFLPDYRFQLELTKPLEITCLWLFMDREYHEYLMVLRSVHKGGDEFERIGLLRLNLDESCRDDMDATQMTLTIV